MAKLFLLLAGTCLAVVLTQAQKPDVRKREDILVLGGYTDKLRKNTDRIDGEIYVPVYGEGAKDRKIAAFPRARHGLAAARLGGALYACGAENEMDRKTCFRWNDQFNNWAPIAAMKTARAQFGMAELGGYLYAVGSNGEEPIVERYSPITNKWEDVKSIPASKGSNRGRGRRRPNGHSSSSVRAHGVASMGGYLWVVGVGPGNDEVYRYDHVIDDWHKMAPLKQARWNFALVTVPQEESEEDEAAGTVHKGPWLYAIGGWSPKNNAASTSWERYDMSTNKWEEMTKAKLNEPREQFGGAFVDGAVYILGGKSSTKGFNPTDIVERLQLDEHREPEGGWEAVQSLRTPRDGHAVVVLV